MMCYCDIHQTRRIILVKCKKEETITEVFREIVKKNFHKPEKLCMGRVTEFYNKSTNKF